MSKQLRRLIQELGREFDSEDNNAFDLWTWLPSYKEAQKYHGDYACEQQPSMADLMHEATLYIGRLNDMLKNKNGPLTDEETNFYSCPCGDEFHGKED